jgi:acyl dehydratase
MLSLFIVGLCASIALLIIGSRLTYRRLGIHALRPLLNAAPHTHIAFANTQFTAPRFYVTLFYVIGRTVLRRCGIRSTPTYTLHNGAYRIPYASSLSMPFRWSERDVALYRQCIANESGTDHDNDDGADTLANPLQLQLYLSATTMPAMLLLVARSGCPINPIGAVNVRNRFEIVHDDCSATFLAGATGLWVHASLADEVVLVKRGWEFGIVVELRSEDGTVLYRQIFTLLQFDKHSSSSLPHRTVGSTKETNSGTAPQASSSTPHTRTITLHSTSPTDWATLTNDRNPIHMSSTLARLFGFRSKIAHGNHVVAKGVHSLRDVLDGVGSWMQVEFRRPCFVPSTKEVWAEQEGEGRVVRGFEVREGQKVNVAVRFGGLGQSI